MQTFEWGMFGLSDLVPHVRRVREDGLLAETPHLLVSARPAKDVQINCLSCEDGFIDPFTSYMTTQSQTEEHFMSDLMPTRLPHN